MDRHISEKYQEVTTEQNRTTRYYGVKPGDKQVTEFKSVGERTKWEQSLDAGTNIYNARNKAELEARRKAGQKK